MRIPPIELVADVRNMVGESPLWDGGTQSLYWVDIPARKVFNWNSVTGMLRSWQTPEMIACIALDRCGGLIAGMESGIFRLDLREGGNAGVIRLTGVAHASAPMRFNDGRCDRQGRFWCGSMHCDMNQDQTVGALYRFDGRGLSSPQVNRLIVPNGLAWSPDGRTMYLSDSHPHVRAIWAFDFDIDDGVATNRRLWIDMRAYAGRPDGAAVDADGCYWICGNDAGVVYRFTPDGVLDRSVAVPVRKPAMCAFGGAGLVTLFVTSIRSDGIDLSDQPLAGGVFAFHAGVKGLNEAGFAG